MNKVNSNSFGLMAIVHCGFLRIRSTFYSYPQFHVRNNLRIKLMRNTLCDFLIIRRIGDDDDDGNGDNDDGDDGDDGDNDDDENGHICFEVRTHAARIVAR